MYIFIGTLYLIAYCFLILVYFFDSTLRRALKEPLRQKAAVRDQINFQKSTWQNGKQGTKGNTPFFGFFITSLYIVFILSVSFSVVSLLTSILFSQLFRCLFYSYFQILLKLGNLLRSKIKSIDEI